MTLNLDKFRISVVCEAAGILDKADKVFSIQHLITHGALYGTFNGHNLIGDGDKQDVIVLQVIGSSNGGIGHVLVQVQGANLSGTGELDITD